MKMLTPRGAACIARKRVEVARQGRRRKMCKNCGSDTLDSGGAAYRPITFCRDCGSVVVAEPDLRTDAQSSQPLSTGNQQDIDPVLAGYAKIQNAWLKKARVFDQSEKNFAMALGEVTGICLAHALDMKVAEKAADICRAAFELTFRGYSTRAVAAASVYAAARHYSLGMSLSELVMHSKNTTVELSQCFKSLQRKLDLTFSAPTPMQHASRLLSLLSLESNERNAIGMAIFNKLDRLVSVSTFQGRNPAGIAGAAIYLASDARRIRLTQREIANTIGVTESTVMNCCKLLRAEKVYF